MRKIKKINGFLVVKFNDREKREYEGTALGEYGVIDAEVYTGNLDIDRGAMEYDDADTLEVAVELARGLESEEDITDEPPTYTAAVETNDRGLDAPPCHAGQEQALPRHRPAHRRARALRLQDGAASDRLPAGERGHHRPGHLRRGTAGRPYAAQPRRAAGVRVRRTVQEPGRTHAGGAGRHLREVPAGTALRGRGGTRPTHPGAERASAAGAHRGREAR